MGELNIRFVLVFWFVGFWQHPKWKWVTISAKLQKCNKPRRLFGFLLLIQYPKPYIDGVSSSARKQNLAVIIFFKQPTKTTNTAANLELRDVVMFLKVRFSVVACWQQQQGHHQHKTTTPKQKHQASTIQNQDRVHRSLVLGSYSFECFFRVSV